MVRPGSLNQTDTVSSLKGNLNNEEHTTQSQQNLRFPSFVIEIATLHNNDSSLLECDLHFQRYWVSSSFKINVSLKRREPLPPAIQRHIADNTNPLTQSRMKFNNAHCILRTRY